MNNVQRLFQSSETSKEFARGYLDYLSKLLSALDVQEIARFVDILFDARNRDAGIFFIGNGGSAATASHFANDIGIGSRSWDRPFRVSALTDNIAILTAIANDYGYSDTFLLQLKNQARPGDVLVAISASGNSENIIKAVNYANSNQISTVGLTGFDGGELKKVAQLGIHVNCEHGEYGPVEDIHMVVDHLIGAFLMYSQEET